ncbi:MAG: hypothetical protein SF002_13610 [Alphaproteobacteria bacterium]|nr:hypothetical protein [Alphaproteobacteria bacterium]
MIDAALYLVSAALTAIGLTQIKLAAAAGVLARFEVWSWAVLGGWFAVYLAGMALWLAAIGRNPLSTAYPIGIGLSLASATIAAWWWLGEGIGPLRLAGIALVLIGGVLVARASAGDGH